MKKDLIHRLKSPSLKGAIDILKAAGTEDEQLFEKAKHQDGDMHPNGKWVWVSSANGGKGDWRTNNGRTHKKHQANTGGSASSGTTTTTATSQSQSQVKNNNANQQSSLNMSNITKEKLDDLEDGSIIEVSYAQTKDTAIKFTKINGEWRIKRDTSKIETSAPTDRILSLLNKHSGQTYRTDFSRVKQSQPKSTTAPKTDKERLDLQQEYSTLNQLIKKPSTSTANKKRFQDRMKEIEGMGLQVVKGKLQWKDTGVGVTPKTKSKLTKQQQAIVYDFMDKVKTSDSKYSDPTKITLSKTEKGNWYVKYDGHQVATIAPGGLTEKIAEAAGMKIEKTSSTSQKKKTKKERTTSDTNKRGESFSVNDTVKYNVGQTQQTGKIIEIDDDGRYVKVRNSIGDIDYKSVEDIKSKEPKEQKKLRPVGTGTNGPERRRKTTTKKSKYSEMSVEDLGKLKGKTLVKEDKMYGGKSEYTITGVKKRGNTIDIEYSDGSITRSITPSMLDSGSSYYGFSVSDKELNLKTNSTNSSNRISMQDRVLHGLARSRNKDIDEGWDEN